MKADLKCLFKAWGHSREEDADGVTVYRPRGYKFPLSRGRDWLEFRADGTVVFLGSGPDDRNSAVDGTWVAAGDDMLDISRGAGEAQQRLTIVECSDTALRVRSA